MFLDKTSLKKSIKISRKPEFKGKVIILENYDMNISRHMVSGVDVWLNNPRRPMEASGTSGQKVPLNGGLNFSVLDGWWREGFDGEEWLDYWIKKKTIQMMKFKILKTHKISTEL